VAEKRQLAKTVTPSSVACFGSSSSASWVSAFRRTTTTSAPTTAVTAAPYFAPKIEEWTDIHIPFVVAAAAANHRTKL
jgi:hypothetical protein